jgi:hypothetical protein
VPQNHHKQHHWHRYNLGGTKLSNTAGVKWCLVRERVQLTHSLLATSKARTISSDGIMYNTTRHTLVTSLHRRLLKVTKTVGTSQFIFPKIQNAHDLTGVRWQTTSALLNEVHWIKHDCARMTATHVMVHACAFVVFDMCR